MRLYESAQSALGQRIAGVAGIEIPGTDINIDRPPIPFVEMSFQNNMLVGAAGAVAGFGVYKTIKYRNRTRDLVENTTYPAGNDYGEANRKGIVNGRGSELAAGIMATTAIVSGFADAAGPYTEEKINQVDNVAVVVDSGYEGYAEDVQTEFGAETRIEAIVNSINQLELDGVNVTFIAAGREPEVVGSIENGSGKNDVVAGFREYTAGNGQRGTETNGGGDIETGLDIAAGLNPDTTIVFAGTLEGNDQSSLLEGQAAEGNNEVIVIAAGQPGSTVDSLGGEAKAPINPAFNEVVVGSEDSYTAQTDKELKDVVSNVINEEIVTIERDKVKLFERVRNISTGLFVVLGFAKFAKDGRSKRKKQ